MNPLLISCGRYDANMMNYLSDCLKKRSHTPSVMSFFDDFFDYKKPPECAIILGDKYEHLKCAMNAYRADVPVVHLHGGEITDCHKDNGYRWAISQIASAHFAATRLSKDRLVHAGFREKNVSMVGALGVEILLGIKDEILVTNPHVKMTIGISYNPQKDEDAQEIVKACNAINEIYREVDFIITAPGRDPGYSIVLDELRQIKGNVSVFDELGMKYYHLLKQATVMIGNSSSLVIEAPIAGCGIVLVGDRQTGRELASNIIQVPCGEYFIVEAVKKALNTDPVEIEDHPYYHPDTSKLIIDKLEEIFGNV